MKQISFTIKIPDNHEDQCIEWLLAHLATRGYECLGIDVKEMQE